MASAMAGTVRKLCMKQAAFNPPPVACSSFFAIASFFAENRFPLFRTML
jgi:hypothetical protein